MDKLVPVCINIGYFNVINYKFQTLTNVQTSFTIVTLTEPVKILYLDLRVHVTKATLETG